MRMNIAIVDDAAADRVQMGEVLQDYSARQGWNFSIAYYDGAPALLADFHAFRFTLIFLDIFMEGMDGIACAQQIRQLDDQVLLVFLTSSEEHMPEAFRCHAYDYIQKPIDPLRVERLLGDIFRRFRDTETPLFHFVSDRVSNSIPCADIAAISIIDHYLEILDKKGQVQRTRMTLRAARAQLGEDSRFLTIIRGVLVNMDYISSFENGICRLQTGDQFPVNVRNYAKIQQTWQNYLFCKIRQTL